MNLNFPLKKSWQLYKWRQRSSEEYALRGTMSDGGGGEGEDIRSLKSNLTSAPVTMTLDSYILCAMS